MYQKVKLNISPQKQKSALMGRSITLKKDDIGTGQDVYLHPLNYKKVNNANSGVVLKLSPGEIMYTAKEHSLLPKPSSSDLSGSGFFDDVWNGLKQAGQWLKDTGIATNIADALVPVASTVIGPTGANLARKVLKGVAGVGLNEKPTKTTKKKSKGTGLYL